MCARLPTGDFFISDYIRSNLVGRNFVAKQQGLTLKGTMTFRELLRIMWNTAALPNCIASEFGFAFGTYEGEVVKDESGDAVYFFAPGLDVFSVELE
jgi:hypothetical protein